MHYLAPPFNDIFNKFWYLFASIPFALVFVSMRWVQRILILVQNLYPPSIYSNFRTFRWSASSVIFFENFNRIHFLCEYILSFDGRINEWTNEWMKSTYISFEMCYFFDAFWLLQIILKWFRLCSLFLVLLSASSSSSFADGNMHKEANVACQATYLNKSIGKSSNNFISVQTVLEK